MSQLTRASYTERKTGFTPTPLEVRGFTLMELLIVIAVMAFIGGIGAQRYFVARERALGKQAIAALRFIAMAEDTYKLENNRYTSCNCVNVANCNNASGCNTRLRLDLIPSTNTWQYGVSAPGGGASFTATATRSSGSGCVYTSTNASPEPAPNASCP